MGILLLLFLGITPSSSVTFDDATDLVHFSVEVNFTNGGWKLQTEKVDAPTPHFSLIRFNPISIALWPRNNSKGAALILIRSCGSEFWRVIVQAAYFPIQPTIVPGYEVRLKQPCDHIQLEMHWIGEVGANFEIQGTAVLEP